MLCRYCVYFFFYVNGDHRDLHVCPHSFPTRRSSDLAPITVDLAAMFDGGADGIVKFQVNGQDVAGTTYTFDPSTGVGSYDFTVTAIDADGDRKSTRLNSSH